MSVPEPSFPPPPPPMGIPSAPVAVIPSNGYTNGPQDTGGGGRGPLIGGEQAQPSFDEWDDEWDDDDESSNSTVGTSGGQVLLLALGFCVPNRDLDITSKKILCEDECCAERERGRERDCHVKASWETTKHWSVTVDYVLTRYQSWAHTYAIELL